jgi:[ribosomal protein S5]-alanine N-acetyltransferase
MATADSESGKKEMELANAKFPEDEILEKLLTLSLEDQSVLVPFTKQDIELWKSFAEYQKNRRNWDTWREEDWRKNQPPHIHSLFHDWPASFETPRLRLRLLTENDTEDAFRILSNPTSMKYYGTAPHKDIEYTRKQFIHLMISRFKYRDAVSFVVTLKENDRYIGHITLAQFDRAFKFVEIAYIIDPEYWGKGYGTEALGRAVEFLQKDIKIHKIRASVFAKNLASKRVLEKLGFIQEGYLKDNVIIDGELADECLMALISEGSELEWVRTQDEAPAAGQAAQSEQTEQTEQPEQNEEVSINN